MLIRRRFVLLKPEEEMSTGGGVVDTPSPDVPAEATPTVEPPKTMFEAISRGLEQQAEHGQPRDEKGRFSAKTETPEASETALPGAAPQGAQPTAKPAEKPAEKPVAEEDQLQMPEGLQPKAQERFQRLANENKELSTRITEWEPIVQSAQAIQETFRENGVTREQFEQATSFIGAINRGDMQGALKLLDEQRKIIALQLGQPLEGVDALADFPDLKSAVENAEISEPYALQLARNRAAQAQRQQTERQAQEQQQTQMQAQQAFEQGQSAVDAFCRKMQAEDMDYPEIEKALLPEIGNLLSGVPPQQWVKVLETNYRLYKRAAQSSRTQAPGGNVLRATGAASPQQAPRSAFEAMWGKPTPM